MFLNSGNGPKKVLSGMKTNSKKHRLLVLDSLRGLAALYVVIFHTALVPHPNLLVPALAERVVLFGGSGVLLFFVISGFSLSMTMPRHQKEPSPLLSYGASRLFRIAPLFYAVLIVSMMRDFIVFGQPTRPANLALNAAFMFNFVPGHQEGIVWASWTIGVEMVYYAVFPFIYKLSTVNKTIFAGGSIIAYWVMNLVPGASRVSYFSILGFIAIFIFGELAFLAYARLRLHANARSWGAIATTGGAILVLLTMLTGNSARSLDQRLVVGLGYALLLLGLTLRSVRFMNSPILGFYGRISYSLYLCHASIVYALSPLYIRVFTMVPVDYAFVVCVAITLIVATPVAWLCYQYIERPGMRVGAKLLASIRRNEFGKLIISLS